MPRKKWDQAPEPNEQHRRIASEARVRAAVDEARRNEWLRRRADGLVEAACELLDRDGVRDDREANARRIAGALLSDAIARVLKGGPPDNA